MTKFAAFGTLLKRGGVTIAQVTNISGPGLSLDTVDVTSHDSAGGWEEVVGTILRSGEIKLDLVYDPNTATHKYAAGGMLSDLTLKIATAYTLVFPSTATVTWSFNAFVTHFEPSAPVDGDLSATATLKITGQPTLV
jgi:predicted secreted protein